MTQPSHRTVRTGPYTAPAPRFSVFLRKDSGLDLRQVIKAKLRQVAITDCHAGVGTARRTPRSHSHLLEFALKAHLSQATLEPTGFLP